MGSEVPCPLPDDPTLCAIACALNKAGLWAEIFDAGWRCRFITDEARLMYGGWSELAPYPVGHHFFGSESVTTEKCGAVANGPLKLIGRRDWCIPKSGCRGQDHNVHRLVPAANLHPVRTATGVLFLDQ